MKKIFCLLLSIVLTFALFGCNKVSDPTITEPGNITDSIDTATTPTEQDEKPKGKYEGDLLSSDAFISAFDKDDVINLLKSINGKVLDIYYYNQCLYLLTDSAIYQCHSAGMFIDTIPVDVTGCVSIYAISKGYIILINNDGKYVVYGEHVYTDEYVECDFNVYVTNGLEYIAINKGTSCIDESIYQIHSTNNNKFTVSVYEFKGKYDENYKFVQESSGKQFSIGNISEKNIKGFYTAHYSDTEGVVLFDNGDLHLANMNFGSIYSDREFFVYKDYFTNIDRVFTTNSYYTYYATKNDDSSNLYLYCVKYDENKGNHMNEVKIPLPDNIKTSDIEEFVDCYASYDCYYIKLTNGKWMYFDNHTANIDSDMTVEEFKKKYNDDVANKWCLEVDDDIVLNAYTVEFSEDDFYQSIKDNVRSIGKVFGQGVYLMDDGHLYIKTVNDQ